MKAFATLSARIVALAVCIQMTALAAFAQGCVLPMDVTGEQFVSDGDKLQVKPRTLVGRSIQRIEFTIDAGPVNSIAPNRIAPDGTAEIEFGLASPADLVLKPDVPQFITIKAYDSANDCGRQTVRAMIRGKDPVAVVIGTNTVKGDYRQLLYARADAEGIAQHFVSALKVKPSNVWLLVDEPQKVKNTASVNLRELTDYTVISRAIAEAGDRAGRGAVFYFYFSGHQFVKRILGEENYFFIMPNSSPRDEDISQMYSWETFAADLTQLKAEGRIIVAIVDSCFSGGVTAVGGGTPILASRAPKGHKALAPASITRWSTSKYPYFTNAFYASSYADQSSWEFDELGHGVFTHFMLDASRWAKEKGVTMTISDAFDNWDPALKKGSLHLTLEYKPAKEDVRAIYQQKPWSNTDSDAKSTVMWTRFP